MKGERDFLRLVFEWIIETERAVGLSDAHELVVLADAFGAAERAGLDLASTETNGKVRDGSILGLTGTM